LIFRGGRRRRRRRGRGLFNISEILATEAFTFHDRIGEKVDI